MSINEEARRKAEEERQVSYPKALLTQKHGEVAAELMKWLVRNRLPETGAGLLEGQWGVYKTFITLNLSAHAIFGWDWTGEPIYRQCGVLAFAPEGGSSIAMRFAAHVEHKIKPHVGDANLFNPAYPPKQVDINRLPFEWVKDKPVIARHRNKKSTAGNDRYRSRHARSLHARTRLAAWVDLDRHNGHGRRVDR